MKNMLEIQSNLELFVDDYLLDQDVTTAERLIHYPVRRECVLVHDAPYEGNMSDYHNLFYDDGVYRLYYLGWTFRRRGIVVCYAESRDGIHFTKPELGICEYEGSKTNNIILTPDMHKVGSGLDSVGIDNFMVFRDDNPACEPAQRYKAVASWGFLDNGKPRNGLRTYYSADAIHFTPSHVISVDGAYDSLNVAFWDETAKKYRCYFRHFHAAGSTAYNAVEQINTASDVRDIRYMESPDFVNWTEPKILDFGDAEDIPLYTNVVQPYPFAPQILVGFPSRYIERKGWSDSFEQLCGKENRLDRMKTSPRYGLTVTDCVLICSRDGLHFQKYDEAFMRPDPEDGFNWVYGDCYPSRGMIMTPSAQSGADAELSIYAMANHWMDKPAELVRYTLRRDGFVSLHAGVEEKRILTKEFTYRGEKLFANMETSAWGHMYFTLIGPDGTRYESCEYFGNSVEKEIVMPENCIKALSGQPVKLEIRLRDADLYAIRFGE